jgi:hypothetical protein
MKREQAIRFLKAQPELQGATIFNLEEGKCLSFIAVIKDVFYWATWNEIDGVELVKATSLNEEE